jgi:hypothetical protein
MADAAQPATYALFHRKPLPNPMGVLIDPVTAQRVPQKFRRPASAPVHRHPPPGQTELRHRAWAPPPGGRKTLQEHLNIWGPCFGSQNTSWQRRYTSEMRRTYQGRQIPGVGDKPPTFRQPTAATAAKKKKKARPQSAPAPKKLPAFKF